MKVGLWKGLFVLLLSLMVIAPVAFTAELGPDMTQGQFALWLVKAIGASSKLPPAATEDDAINFLLGLGVYPEDGWKKDEAISNEFLASLLGDEEGGTGTFEELVDRVRDHVQNLFANTHQGVFRAAASSGSGSVVAG